MVTVGGSWLQLDEVGDSRGKLVTVGPTIINFPLLSPISPLPSPNFSYCHQLALKTTNFFPLSTTFIIFKNLNHFCYSDFSKFQNLTPTFRFFKNSPRLEKSRGKKNALILIMFLTISCYFVRRIGE